MKFQELQLLAFGPFTDNVLRLDESAAGLHLIYGPNEAGKSSALRAIDALLYGIPLRTSDNFVHAYGDLRLGARIRNAAGRELSFVRRKRQRKSLVSFADHEQPLAENALEDFLKGLQRGTFAQLYCIDHDEFRAGGERMRQMQGLLGESLFAASLGGSALADVLERLDEAAHGRWSRRSGSIRAGIAQYQEHRESRTGAEVSGKRWKTLHDELSALETRKAEVVRQQTTWETQRRRWERLLTARPKVQAYRRIQAELGEAELNVLPLSYSASERTRCEAALEATTQQLSQLDQKGQVAEQALSDAAGSVALLPFAETIDRLLQRLGHQWELEDQREAVQQAREQASAQAHRLLSELGQTMELEEAQQLRVRREHRAAIQQLATQERHLRERVQALQRRLSKLATELSGAARDLEALPQPTDLAPLRQALAASVPGLDEMERLSQCERDAQRNLERALSDWAGGLNREQVTRIKVPLPGTVEAFRDRCRTLERQREAVQTRMDQCQEERRQTRVALESLLGAGDVVSEPDLKDERARRDALWGELRRCLAEPSAVCDADHLTQYEQHLHASDEIADRLRREADRVAVRARESARLAQLDALDEKLAQRAVEIDQVATQWQSEWAACWSEVPLDRLGTPEEMLAWLGQRDRVIERVDAHTGHAERSQAAAASRLAAQQGCRDVLAAQGLDVDGDESWETLRRRVETRLQEQEAIAREREQRTREHARVEQEHVVLADELHDAQAEQQTWQSKWSEAMDWIGLEGAVTAAQALARLECLEELDESVNAWKRQGGLLRDATQSQQRFQADVLSLASQLNETDVTEPATSLVTRWKEELAEQRQRADALQHHQRHQQELTREREELDSRREALEQQLAHFVRVAGVASVAELPEVEARSEQIRHLRELETELQAARGNLDWDTFLAEAEATDEAELETRIAELTRAIEEEDANRDALVAQLTERKAAMAEIDGNDRAASADQRAMSQLAGVYEEAREFIRLRLAAGLLRQQIERYRDENRDPLLARASCFFSQMTLQQFEGLKADYNEQGASVLLAQRDGDTDVPMDALSDGTLDPVYLSLRLAYLERRFQQYEPMPLVVDDILIHLDDERALATLRVLAELAEQTQVLFFTHHARLKELAATHLADGVAIHELVPRWAQRPKSA